MPFIILGGLVLGGYVLTTPNDRPDPKDFGTHRPRMNDIESMNLRDIQDAGFLTGIERASNINIANVNEAYKPLSAPDQTPIRSLFTFCQNQAKRTALLAEYGHDFYFERNGEIPLGTGEQQMLNVEVPGGGSNSSIRGDPGNSLSYYARVYRDYHGSNNPHLFSNNSKTWNAGEPEEWSQMFVPREGQKREEWNPWGPGGVLQRVFTTRQERETRTKKVDRSRVLAPPPTTYYNNIYG